MDIGCSHPGTQPHPVHPWLLPKQKVAGSSPVSRSARSLCESLGKRRLMPIELLPNSPEWPVRYERLAEALRQALGCVAVRVDQIRSTALPGLAAKGVIDIQVSVRALEPEGPHRWPFERRDHASRPDDELERRLGTSNQTVGRRLPNIHPWVAGGPLEVASLGISRFPAAPFPNHQGICASQETGQCSIR